MGAEGLRKPWTLGRPDICVLLHGMFLHSERIADWKVQFSVMHILSERTANACPRIFKVILRVLALVLEEIANLQR